MQSFFHSWCDTLQKTIDYSRSQSIQFVSNGYYSLLQAYPHITTSYIYKHCPSIRLGDRVLVTHMRINHNVKKEFKVTPLFYTSLPDFHHKLFKLLTAQHFELVIFSRLDLFSIVIIDPSLLTLLGQKTKTIFFEFEQENNGFCLENKWKQKEEFLLFLHQHGFFEVEICDGSIIHVTRRNQIFGLYPYFDTPSRKGQKYIVARKLPKHHMFSQIEDYA